MLDMVNLAVDMVAAILIVVIIARMIPRINMGERTMPATLFLFAMVSLLLSNIYWFTYTLMRPDTRMPFAANEIGEIALYLLLAAMLYAVFHDYDRPATKEVLFMAVFSAASIGLWIAWTGEWFQDIVGGLAFGYLLCTCVRCLKQTDALCTAEWILSGVVLTVVILIQSLTLSLTGAPKKTYDFISYALLFVLLIHYLMKSIRRTARGADKLGNLALSCATYAYCLSTMYMSEGWFYTAAMISGLVAIPLIAIAVRREIGE